LKAGRVNTSKCESRAQLNPAWIESRRESERLAGAEPILAAEAAVAPDNVADIATAGPSCQCGGVGRIHRGARGSVVDALVVQVVEQVESLKHQVQIARHAHAEAAVQAHVKGPERRTLSDIASGKVGTIRSAVAISV